MDIQCVDKQCVLTKRTSTGKKTGDVTVGKGHPFCFIFLDTKRICTSGLK